MKATREQVKAQQERAWRAHVKALDELERRRNRRRIAAMRRGDR